MDNRLRFLYRMVTELWGRMTKLEPGMERPVQAKEEYGWQIRRIIQERDVE